MSDSGTLEWIDLTVEDAEAVRDFYVGVVGWTAEPVSMGDYDDWSLTAAGNPVAGVCHARGANARMPAVWIPYFRVRDLEVSLERCRASGGVVLDGPRSLGPDMRFAAIRDPSGAACALFESDS